MDHEGLGVQDVREMRGKLHRVDELGACFIPALDPEAEDCAGSQRQVVLDARVVGVIGKTCVGDPSHRRMSFEMSRHHIRVRRVRPGAQGQGLQPLDEQP